MSLDQRHQRLGNALVGPALLFERLLKRLHYTGSTLRSRPAAFKADVARELEAKVWPLFATGRLRAVIGTTLPLEQAAEAHALMERAGHRGKIGLQVT